ncbi:MAG: S-adenosylmethionine:tRNA ribosyltransferase-isomerase [Flavisolibacter sp.]
MNILPQEILIKDYTYALPHNRIAEFPLEERDKSKLLVYKNGEINDDKFYHLPQHLQPGTTVILNNTRVIEARVLFKKETGGLIEIFCLEPYQQSIEQAMQQKEKAVWKCLIGGASKWKAGQILQKSSFSPSHQFHLFAKYIDKKEDFFLIEFDWQPPELSFVEVLHSTGAIPLPPYIKRSAEKTDWERYQTVFSKHEGSVAAPTAALHFTQKTFEELTVKNIQADYVTLHVGAGTFKPVKTETIAAHQMHSEPFTASKELIERLMISKKIVAVGTTSLRTLESLYWLGLKVKNTIVDELELGQWEAYALGQQYSDVSYKVSLQNLLSWMQVHETEEIHCKTSLIIVPGYQFKIPDALITNFHQPQSTLLLLIAAFIGEDWKKVYQHALDNDYRFLSYGDSSLLWRRES